MPSDIAIVPATQALARAYWGGAPPYSFRGYAAVRGTEPLGFAGVFRAYGRLWAFSGFRPELRPYRKVRVAGVRKLVSLLDELPCPVYATADPAEETAPALLARLGFAPTGEFLDGVEILSRRPYVRHGDTGRCT